MDNFITRIFTTDKYDTIARKELARLIYILATLLLVADVILIGILPDNTDGSSILMYALQNGMTPSALAGIIAFFTLIGIIVLIRSGYYEIAAWTINGLALVAAAILIFYTQETDFEYLILALSATVATLTLGTRGLVLIGGGSIVLYASIFFTASSSEALRATIEGFILYIVILVILYVFIRFAGARRTEGQLIESAERFKLAEINTRITRQASERVSLDQTLENTLDLILESYPQFYHAQVFLIDEDGVQARLTASTGETGQQLIDKGHSLAVGTLSVIGQTTFKGEPVIARTNDQESIHRENQLLPQTRVEAAFPLRIGDKVIGALDLQSRENLPLTDFDMLTFQSLANSLSLAIDSIQQYEAAKTRIAENQRLTEQTRNALRDVERLNQRLIGRAWSEYLSGKGNQLGLDIDLLTSETTPDTNWTDSLTNAAQTVSIVQDDNVIAIPLKVRGVLVGAMEFELDEGSEFTPADMELVQEVSERFGLAAENTRLVEQSQRVAQRESLINEISSRLQSAINIESTLAEAARSLSDTLQANKVMIRLGAPNEEQPQANGHTNGARE